MGVLYCKDVWDFCLGGLKNRVLVTLFLQFGDYRSPNAKIFYILITENAFSIFKFYNQ